MSELSVIKCARCHTGKPSNLFKTKSNGNIYKVCTPCRKRSNQKYHEKKNKLINEQIDQVDEIIKVDKVDKVDENIKIDKNVSSQEDNKGIDKKYLIGGGLGLIGLISLLGSSSKQAQANAQNYII